MDVPEYLTPAGFARAWSPEVPGPMLDPGPRQTPVPGAIDAVPGVEGLPVADILRAVWWSDGFHTNPATGHPGKVRKRGVPSAGGCYPVQLHVFCGAGCDVPPGAYVVNGSTGGLLRRADNDAGARQRGCAAAPEVGAVVVLTVLPQRTAAKYHHRTGPLLIADTAYAAVALIHHAAARSVAADWAILEPQAWPGFPRETALARVALRGSAPLPEFQGVSRQQLAARRSADAFQPRSGGSRTTGFRAMVGPLSSQGPTVPAKPRACRTRLIHGEALNATELAEHCAHQRWIRNLDALLVFETAAPPDPEALWWASSAAAHALYSALGAGDAVDFRPVGGWTGTLNGWTVLHGLGVLRRDTKPTDERDTHAGQ
ncbi:hypothetical protein ACIPWF_16785 [Paenarthrobacter sp. NPDC089989]|uniref:hypothetical protein n=1 Tax=unclassified Paenarthrobacter TaxID=2634190 RepID=UPI0037FD388A